MIKGGMAKRIFGPACAGAPFLGAATLFDPPAQVLLPAADNGEWVLPGGGVESGESLADACAREMLEETGLSVRVVRLLGVYSNPDMLLTYASGGRFHLIAHNFLVEHIAGEPGTSDEVTDSGWYGPAG